MIDYEDALIYEKCAACLRFCQGDKIYVRGERTGLVIIIIIHKDYAQVVVVIIRASVEVCSSGFTQKFTQKKSHITSARFYPLKRRNVLVEHHKLSSTPFSTRVDQRVGGLL